MAGDTTSNIFINVDTSQAMAQLRALEKELTALNRSLIVGTKAAAAAQAKYAQSLLHNVNATGQWTASMTRMSTASEQFSERLDRQRLSLKEYFRYGMASTKTFGRLFGSEFDTLGKLVDKRVKTLQQQYVQLGRDAQGAMNAMKFNPKVLNYGDVTTKLMLATQRQQIFNKLIDDGATKLLNFGKNTQWAGRQLMVGFTIPLMLFGAQAIKTFKEIETQVIRFKKVYGDIFTDQGATDQALKNIRALGDEYTKYGLKVADTIKTAADAAAAGFSGKGLETLVEQTNKLAVLGGVTQEKALETTIALKNAFQIDTGAMSGTIDFLNAVENQTVVALDDLTEAIPKVAPVIQQLGGDVKDLAYFMAAMQEGGISAAQGANALKSGLASLINPSNAASKAAAKVGINIKGIVEANAGNLRNTVTAFANALKPLTDLQRSQIIEKVFGKYQFARISALLNNITREGTQAARVLELTNASAEELAILSKRELKIQADSSMNKLASAIEKLKVSIAPVGELFAKVFTPIIEFVAKIADKFNSLPDGIKKAIGVITIVVGGLGPLFLMTFGLLANAVANSVKGIQVLRKGYQQLSAGSSDAALKTQYLTQQELENISVSNALYSKHQQLSAAYQLEATALSSLMSTYKQANIAMGGFAANNPGMFMPRGGVALPKKFATGTTSVPGPRGAGDVIPAMLSPGESVIPVKQTQKYSGFINQIIQDKVPGFMAGRVGAFPSFGAAAAVERVSSRGVIGPKAPVISIASGFAGRPGLSGIQFAEGSGGLVIVKAGSQSFKVKKENVEELKRLLTENQTWLESKGRLPGGGVSSKKGYADTTEGKLEHVLRTRLAGEDVLTPKKIFSKLQKYDASKVRAVPKEIKSLRAKYKDSPIYKELVGVHKGEIEALKTLAKTKPNPYGLTEEDLLTIQGAQGANAKEFKYSPALSHRFTDRQVGELSGLTQYKRNAPSNVFEEQSFLNKYFQDISKTSVGGMHISRRDQAEAARNLILDKPASKRSAIEKAVHATLDRRLSTGYYEKFGSKTNQLSLLKDAGLTNEQIKAFPRTGIPELAGGVVSLGMPIAFKTIAKNRAIAQQIDARVRSSAFREVAPTNFGVKLQEFSGHSFPIPGIGGVYRKPNGEVVVVKPVLDEKAALAEQRATVIARQAHGLDAPEQTIRTMIDPTDLTGKRKIIVLESPYNPKFATGGTKFSKEEYFKQLVASTLRGDKDLSPSNVFGGTVADVGAAGVFGKASGARDFNFNMPSMQDQAMINLLGVKGGARKAFAENTADIARSMTPAEYQKAMLDEINATLPKLEKTIASFNLTKVEQVVYQRMIDRLKDGRNVDWAKFHEVHSKVKTPLKLANGIVSVPGPKGAGDIQPAMLSPGEAVIPAKQSAKYMPLIQSMVADNVPGFAESNITPWTGNPGSWRTDTTATNTPIGSPDKVEKAIDKIFDKPRVKRFTDRLEKLGLQFSKATPKVADLGTTADKTTESFGKDKTRGFRGFLGGYGNVAQTVANEDGTTRVASAAERTNMRQMNRMNFTNKMMPMQMAGMMIPMAAGMVAQKNPEGAVAKNMDAIMMLSMLTMLLPMLNSPLKLLAATAIGLVAVFKMQAATIKKNIAEGQKQAESMTMTTKQLEELGKITGRVSITQIEQAKRAGRNTDLVPVSMEFGNNLLANSDFGKNLKSTFEKSMATFGEGPAVDALVNQLGTAVSQGVLTAGQAESIAVALTRNLKDAKLELNVRGKLTQLIGPNGQNLLDNPLQVQLDLMASGERLQEAALKNMNLVANQQTGINTKGEIAQLGAGAVGGGFVAARAGIQAANMVQMGSNAATIARSEAAIAKATTEIGRVGKALAVARAVRTGGQVASLATSATGVGAVPGMIGLAVSTVIFGGIETAIRQWQKGKEKAQVAKAAGMLQGIISQNMMASQGSIDALTVQYNTAISNLELKKKTLKTEKERNAIDLQIADLESKKQTGLQTLRTKQAQMLKSTGDTYDKVSGQSFFEKISPLGSGRGAVRDKYMEAFSVGMQDKFKDNPALKAQAAGLQAQLDQIGKDKVTLEISTLVTSDILTPNEASTLLNTLTKVGGDINKNLEAVVDVQGTEGLQRLSTILTMVPDETNQKNLLINMKYMNKADGDATMAAIEELGKIPDYIGIDLNIETDSSDIKDLKARGKEIEELKKKFPNGQIDLKALVKMQEEAGGPGKNLTLDAAINQWTAISKLPKELQFQAMISIGSVTQSDSFDKIIDRELTAAFDKANPQLSGPQIFGSTEKREDFNRRRANALAAFKKDADNISKAEKAYWEKVAPQIFGVGNVDDSKTGGAKTGDTGPKRDMSWLNELGQKLKLFKEGAFNALDPLNEIRKFFAGGGAGSKNPMLAAQAGAIGEIEAAAKKAGVVLNKDFMDVVRSMDAEQFKLWSEILFKVSKDGKITGLKEDFIAINGAMTTSMAGVYIDSLREANREIEKQVKAYDILTNAGYNQIEVEKILQNSALVASIADRGFLSVSTEERRDLNAEIEKTINLNYKLAGQKLSGSVNDLNMQVEAYKKLTDAGVKQEIINELIKDKANAWAIANYPGDVAKQFGPLLTQTKNYLDLLKYVENQTKSFEQVTQEAIDANVAALDLQARKLQNEFDVKNFDLKANIKLAEGAVQDVNDKIQEEQDKIDAINFELKYDPKIGQVVLDKMQEQVNDAQRNIDLTFDRPIQALSERSNILSNDLTLIDNAAQKINDKYDAQQEALTKISQLNQDIAAQERGRISLADALSQGDISAAAQQAQEMRSQAAEAANRASGDYLTAAKNAELDALRSPSGMTRKQIEEEQFAIGQRTFELEQKRKEAQAAILVIEDQIYNINELREVKLNAIQAIETRIDGLRNKELKDAETKLNNLQSELDKNQEILDAKLLAIDKEKLGWESVQLQLDSYKSKLTEINDGPLTSMKKLVDSIATALKNMPSVSSLTGGTSGSTATGNKNIVVTDPAAKAKADAEAKAKAEALRIAQEEYDRARLSAYSLQGVPGMATVFNAMVKAFNTKYPNGRPMMYGGMVRPMANGGRIGSDSVSALLTPGEFVMNRKATKTFAPILESMNNSAYPSMMGHLTSPSYNVQTSNTVVSTPINTNSINSVNDNSSSVYNYSVGINVSGSNSNPDEIARAVMTQIKTIDAQRIRNQRA